MSDDVKPTLAEIEEELRALPNTSMIDNDVSVIMDMIRALLAQGLADSERRKVTAAEVAAIATAYDNEYRGGIGRGDIDQELADRLANWFNTGVPSPGPMEQETCRKVDDSQRQLRRQRS